MRADGDTAEAPVAVHGAAPTRPAALAPERARRQDTVRRPPCLSSLSHPNVWPSTLQILGVKHGFQRSKSVIILLPSLGWRRRREVQKCSCRPESRTPQSRHMFTRSCRLLCAGFRAEGAAEARARRRPAQGGSRFDSGRGRGRGRGLLALRGRPPHATCGTGLQPRVRALRPGRIGCDPALSLPAHAYYYSIAPCRGLPELISAASLAPTGGVVERAADWLLTNC